jgi:hypothetical protein
VQGDEGLLIGLEAHNDDLGIEAAKAYMAVISQHWYWEIVADGAFNGSLVQLPLTAEDASWQSATTSPTILQTGKGGEGLTNLGVIDAANPTVLESKLLATGPYLLLGYESTADPVIHNIVTPSEADGKNDHFHINNIAPYAADNLVILLDRWGTEVCRMINFDNDPASQTGCNLSQLPAGNYICLLQYSTKTLPPTMITIIK